MGKGYPLSDFKLNEISLVKCAILENHYSLGRH